jgi:hypothetical protein
MIPIFTCSSWPWDGWTAVLTGCWVVFQCTELIFGFVAWRFLRELIDVPKPEKRLSIPVPHLKRSACLFCQLDKILYRTYHPLRHWEHIFTPLHTPMPRNRRHDPDFKMSHWVLMALAAAVISIVITAWLWGPFGAIFYSVYLWWMLIGPIQYAWNAAFTYLYPLTCRHRDTAPMRESEKEYSLR